MYKMTDVLYAVLTVFQGYCLQYFLGSFLEGRLKSRWNGLCVAVLYVILRIAMKWGLPPGYEDYKVAVGALAMLLCMLSLLAICFYKAFRPVTVFLVVSFLAVLDISRYAPVIFLDEIDGWVIDILNWLVGKDMFQSEKAFGIAIKAGMAGTQLLRYVAIALLLY